MQPLLLLHGAIGSSAQLTELGQSLSGQHEIHLLDFSGHGKDTTAPQVFSMELFACNVLEYLDAHGLSQISLLGYSMGGYVALYFAKKYPERVVKIITLATKFYWDEPTAAKEVQMLQPDKIEAKIPAFAALLKERHNPNDWKKVLSQTAEMMLALGKDNLLKQDDYQHINTLVLLMLGDRDKMVPMEETVNTYKLLPQAQLCILPDTAHPIEQVNTVLLSNVIRSFL